jgi:hypothetical protein
MRMRIEIRRNALVVLSVMAMMMALLAVAPASAHGTECGKYVHKHNGVWTVYPNGSDDTEALVCALNEAAEYSVSGTPTVRLAEGTFYSDFFEVDGFNGRIKGAGRDATTIEPLEGGLDCVAQFEETGFVVWMGFIGSDLIMKDLGLNIPGPACAEPWEEFFEEDPETGEVFGFVAEDFNAMVVVVNGRSQNVSQCGVTGYGGLTAKRLNVTAPPPNFGDPIFNPEGAYNAFFIGGVHPPGCPAHDELVGDVLVRDVHASGVGNLIQAESIAASLIKVVHNHTVGVDASILLFKNEGSVAKVHSNTIEEATGVGVVSDNCVGPEDPNLCLADTSKVYIHHNDIHVSEIGFAGIADLDGFFAPPQVEAKIWKNHITGDGNFAGVFLESVDGDRVSGNTFDGASVFAVLAEGETTRSKIVRNDMTGHLAFEASILLGELTSLNKVKGNAGATVIDLGTGNMVYDAAAAAAFGFAGAAVAERNADRYSSYGWSR